MKYDEKHHLPHPVPITNGKLQSLVFTSNCFQPHYSGKSNQNFLCNSGADEAEKATKAGCEDVRREQSLEPFTNLVLMTL